MEGIKVTQKGVDMMHQMDLGEYYSDGETVGCWKVCSEIDGIRALLVAVLDRAIRDYLAFRDYEPTYENAREAERSAWRWFESDVIYCDSRGMSYAWITQQLRLDRDKLRAGIKQLDSQYEAGGLIVIPAFRRRSIPLRSDALFQGAKLKGAKQQ